MEKAARKGGFFKVPLLWELACSGHTRTYMSEISKFGLNIQGAHPFSYSEKDCEWLDACISSDRMTPYFAKARGDSWVAFHMYVRNTEISASLYGVVQALEVGLRNRVHASMVTALKSQEWWGCLPLHQAENEDVESAKNAIRMRMKPLTAGRIVAELNFGFWIKLFAKSYEKELWVPYLSRLFPARVSRKELHRQLIVWKELRNRIAHHETLLKRSPQDDYLGLLNTIGLLSPTLRRWVEHHSELEQVINRRIPKRSSIESRSPHP